MAQVCHGGSSFRQHGNAIKAQLKKRGYQTKALIDLLKRVGSTDDGQRLLDTQIVSGGLTPLYIPPSAGRVDPAARENCGDHCYASVFHQDHPTRQRAPRWEASVLAR